MKKLLIVIPVAVLCIVFSACNSSDKKDKAVTPEVKKTTEEPKADTKPTEPYSITTPQGWEKKDTVSEGTRLITLRSPKETAGDDFRENITIVSEEARNYDVKSYTAANRSTMAAQLPGVNFISDEEITIGDVPAEALVYTFMYKTYNLKNTAYFIVKNNVGYVLTCTAVNTKFDKFQPQFKAAVNSFVVNN